MRSLLTLPFLLALAGCQGKLEAAQERYEMVKRNGASSDELCEEARKVEDAALDEGDEQAYQFASIERGLNCNRAALDRL